MLAAGMFLGRNPAVTRLGAGIQMGAEKHMERHAGEFLNGQQQVAGRESLAGFPVAPCAGGNAELDGDFGDLAVFHQSPMFQPHAERDARGVVVGFGP